MKHTVLITGCSTGIGRALALEFRRRGHVVYASARRLDAIADLAEKGIHLVALDVTDPAGVELLTAQLSYDGVKPNLVVNNAGYGAMGPLAEMPLAELRRQFETNVFSIVALVQALLPAMMAAPDARIVNISSISGVAPTPFSGAYCASKAAVNALSDALRMELAPFRIKVITVQPGAIQSEFGNSAARFAASQLPEDSLYASMRTAILNRARVSQQKTMPATEFARILANKVTASDPAATIRIGPYSQVLPWMKRWLPEKTLDRMLSRKFGVIDSHSG